VSRFGDGVKPGGGRWLYRIARGLCLDPVNDRQLAHSRGSGKNFGMSKEVMSLDSDLILFMCDRVSALAI